MGCAVSSLAVPMTKPTSNEIHAMDRQIAHANKVVHIHDKKKTPTTIIFMGSKQNKNIDISKKHRELFREILRVDDGAKMIDVKNQEYLKPEDIPDGKSYSDVFTIDDSDTKFGNLYVKCEIVSKFSLYEFKRGPMNIMPFLQSQNIFLQFRKFKTIREATIGFLHSIHPVATLKTELREDLDNYLKSMPLKHEEFEELFSTIDLDDAQQGRGSITFPSYDLVINSFGFGNGDARITTKAFEVRCAPDDAPILKKLFTRISLMSKYKVHFMPNGMLQISGQAAYKNALCSHNEYLSKFATFPVYGISRTQMSQLRPEILQQQGIHRILSTNQTEHNGRWLIETTNQHIERAKTSIDTIIRNNKNFPNEGPNPSRINPEYIHDDIVKLSQDMTDAYSQKRDTPLDTYKSPPTYNPRMISYNLNSNDSPDKLTYKQVATKQTLPNDSTDIIQPTYTEIDWKAQMEKIRQETLDACKQMTQDLIESNNKSLLKISMKKLTKRHVIMIKRWTN